MAKAKIVVTGIPEIDRKLRAMGAKEGNAAVRKSLREAFRPMLAAVQSGTPHGATGTLESSIKLRAGRRSRAGISMLVRTTYKAGTTRESRATGEPYLVADGTPFHAAAVEFGRKGKKGAGMFRRAFDSNAAQARRDAMDRIARAILAIGT